MAAGVAMPEIKTAGPSIGVLDKKEVSFETSIRPEDKVKIFSPMHAPLVPSLIPPSPPALHLLATTAKAPHRGGTSWACVAVCFL